MKNSMRRMTHGTIGIAALALTMMAATPTFARGTRALRIQSVAVAGSALTVTVANDATRPIHGTVAARVLTRRGIVTVRASVFAAAGDTSTVRMNLPDNPVADAPPLGVVVDDGVPF